MYKDMYFFESVFIGIHRRLFLPAFRRVTAAGDLAGLVEPLAVDLDPGGVLLSLSRELHRIAHLLLPVLGENDLRGGRVAVHDDQRILDGHVESGPLARGRWGGSGRRARRRGRASRRSRGGTVVCLPDAFLALVVPGAENQLAVIGIKALFALPVDFAEVVVVTRDLIQDHLAVNQRLRRHLLLRARRRRTCQRDSAQPQHGRPDGGLANGIPFHCIPLFTCAALQQHPELPLSFDRSRDIVTERSGGVGYESRGTVGGKTGVGCSENTAPQRCRSIVPGSWRRPRRHADFPCPSRAAAAADPGRIRRWAAL